MFNQILLTQFKWTRITLASISVVVFLAPAAAWRLGGSLGQPGASAIISGFSGIGPVLAMFAILGSFMLVVQPWQMDHAARHVYALSLPIKWSAYVSLRFAAGAVTLLVPTVALWLGSLLVLSMLDLPETLRGYPGALALRFFIAALLTHAATFLLQYIAGKKAGIVVLLVLVCVALGMILLEATGNRAVSEQIGRFLVEWPGPLSVFAMDWKLIDV